MKIVVTGAGGQLGTCLQELAKKHTEIQWRFTDKDALDICNLRAVSEYFETEKPDYCINSAAYTLVDKAETEPELSYLINHKAIENLAIVAKKTNCMLLHVSTDYVFDGEKTNAYTETDLCNPQSIYGKSKWEGEKSLVKNCENHVIIRTSWLYSPYKANFLKTMLRLMGERNELNVVSDQWGQPTNSLDLAEALILICLSPNKSFGTYHFSNIGQISWFDFATKIARISQSDCQINPITTDQYPTLAQRPKNSTMDCAKIAKDYNIVLKNWETSLEEVMKIIQK